MTIRWKLNLTVALLLAVFLAVAAVECFTIAAQTERVESYLRVRGQSRFIADLRAELQRRVACVSLGTPALQPFGEQDWPRATLDDIDRRVRAEDDDQQRQRWRSVRRAVINLHEALSQSTSPAPVVRALRLAEHNLLALRSHYAAMEHDLIAASASTNFSVKRAILVACAVTVLLFLAYYFLVRRWLVEPVEVLQASADAIGEGQLEHRVPLSGHNELARLARHIDAMAARLSRHQQQLIEARELTAIGELCTNVAHGLKNPLASIRAGAQLAARRAADSPRLQDAIQGIMAEADRMDQRISKLFELARPMEMHFGAVFFRDLLPPVQSETRTLQQATGTKLVVEDHTGQTALNVDREQLSQAVGELVSNAMHHSASGTEVVLRASLRDPSNGKSAHIIIEVIDQGSGMSTATLEQAFTLFFTGRSNGTGMGLTMARRVVERHGGTLSLTSEPGRGTTATVVLPTALPNLPATPREV